MKKRTIVSAKRIFDFLKWLYPGVGLKRWIFVAIIGLILIFFGATHSLNSLRSISFIDWILLISGFLILVISVWGMIYLFIETFFPPTSSSSSIADILYQRNVLSKGPKIVVIGGGSGQSVLLQGLKEYTSNLTAIVTVADSGGSSGRLRNTFDILPPGDIRNCLVALADVEPLVRDLFQYRFDKNVDELGGHSFGNLFLTVLTQITGDFEKAIKAASEVLAIRGRVVPSTFEKISLLAEYEDGSIVKGEADIPKVGKRIKRVFLEPKNPMASQDAITAIKEADLIFLGPGSLYTSIMPNLLVNGIVQSLCKAKAPRIYVCNVMTQKGETDNYTVVDHINAIIEHAGVGVITHCIINSITIPNEALGKYAEEGAKEVKLGDISKIEAMGISILMANVIDISGVIRHNPHKIYSIVKEFFINRR